MKITSLKKSIVIGVAISISSLVLLLHVRKIRKKANVATSKTRLLDKKVKKPIIMFHFNDVYEISNEPGAARFVTTLDRAKATETEPCMVMFSGDAFNPSKLSVLTRGRHMVPILNHCKVTFACVGNHDFDFGIERLQDLIAETGFPWLLANVLDKSTGKPLAGCDPCSTITWNGTKIGIMGLAERDWLDTLATIENDDVIYEDFVIAGRRLSKELRENGAEIVIALTHMRMPNDKILADECEGIDLILGGHDHSVYHYTSSITGTTVVKSGTDFRCMSRVEISINDDEEKPNIDVKLICVPADEPKDANVVSITDKYDSMLKDKIHKSIGFSKVDLDCRFDIIRKEESNISNFIADIMCEVTNADIAILNSGTLRADRIIKAGEMTLGTLMDILPFPDNLVTLEMTGSQVIQALENGVCKYPALEGRFPCVSGVHFSFDPKLEPGSRVLSIHPSTITLRDGKTLLEREKVYRVVTKEYLSRGKDGYTIFLEGKIIDEDGMDLRTAIIEHMRLLNLLNSFSGSSINLENQKSTIVRKAINKFMRKSSIDMKDDNNIVAEKLHFALDAAVEGRITCI